MAAIDGSALGEVHAHRIVRDGDRDISFRGWLLGEGESGSGGTSGYRCDWTRGVTVKIYLTTGGNYVVSKSFWSRWQGEGESFEGGIYRSGEALLEALKTDGALRKAEKEAWEEACVDWAPLAALEAESVD